MGEYQPMVPADHAERIRRWHERLYAERSPATQTVEYLGLRLVVPPLVHPINPMSHLLGDAVRADVRPGERVLDMGTGCGVNGILAAVAGATVVAVDTNPVAVEAARANAARNGVAVDVRHGDLFDGVEGLFDVVVFDPPFRWFAPRDLMETASTDAGYATLTRFFAEVRARLTDAGRLLLSFGTTGDLPYLAKLGADAGFATETVGHDTLTRDGWTVDYYAFRLTSRT